MQNIIENATIVYKNGLKKICEAISITERGVYTGYIKPKNDEEFVNHSFIPKDQIQNIMFFSENGKLKDIEIK